MKIVIPEWLKRESPTTASFCELINVVLENNPNMPLAAFAEQLSESNVEQSFERIQRAEKRQFGEEVK